MQKQWALVTGASSGIGQEISRVLAESGVCLVLVARREERLQALAEELRAKHGVEVLTEAMDLSQAGAALELKQGLDAKGVVVRLLINNAGVGLISRFDEQKTDEIEAMLRLNVVALTELTHAYAQAMKAQRDGRILLVASVAAYQPCPWYAAYAATKAYVLSFGEAIHTELKEHNVFVTVLSPGVTETEFFETAGSPPTSVQMRSIMSARAVAEIGVHAMFAGRSSVVAGGMNKVMAQISRFLPRQWVSWMVYRMLK